MGLLKKVIGLVGKPLLSLISKGREKSEWLNPAKQITAVGGRRVWLTLVLFVVVIVCYLIGMPADVINNILLIGGGVTGSFVLGESARDTVAARRRGEDKEE